MNPEQIDKFRGRVSTLISKRRLREALSMMRETARQAQLPSLADAAERIDGNYSLMLDYLSRGGADPGRRRMYASLIDKSNALLDNIVRQLSVAETPSLYYSLVRTQFHSRLSLDSLTDRWKNLVQTAAEPRQLEQVESDIFNYVWTTMPLSANDADSLSLLSLDPEFSDSLKQLAVSAVILGLLEFFDEQRFNFLIDTYTTATGMCTGDEDDQRLADTLAAMSLAGILVGIIRHHKRRFPEALKQRLEDLNSIPEWHEDLGMACVEIVRTADTDRVTDRMNSDIMPGIADAVRNTDIDLSSISDPEDIDPENPLWQEMLDKSGITDSLRQLTEMQQEGADVFMSTFSHLKGFPFFRDIANWFRPFSATNSYVMDSPLPFQLTQVMESMPLLCNSDKYSFFLSLSQMPEFNRQALVDQLGTMVMADIPKMDSSRRGELSAYLRDLYRFFNLYVRRQEFFNPFVHEVGESIVDRLRDSFNNDSLRLAAEFCFKLGRWTDAAAFFTPIADTAEAIGKLGYTLEKRMDYAEALRQYRRADDDSVWVLTRIAACCQELGDWQGCADACRRVLNHEPENFTALLRLGRSLVKLGDGAAAVEVLFKANYLRPDHRATVRLLVTALLMQGRGDDALKQLAKLSEPLSVDELLLRAYAAITVGCTDISVSSLKSILADSEWNISSLRSRIADDSLARSIDTDTLAMVLDAI